ncbi:MAG: MAPEG family protein [Pseudomonadales bacterium]
MSLFQDYHTALLGLLVIITTILVQMMVAAISKAKQPAAIPGKMDPNLSHSSFVFRANRTFANSVENAPAMLGAAFLAILVGAGPFWAAIWVWTYAISRLIHMGLYYAISTEKNPSPRSHFFLLALIANIALIIQAGLSFI